MRVRKRVLVAIFHIVVISAYLTMWMIKLSEDGVINLKAISTKVWHTPSADAIDEVLSLAFINQGCYISLYDDIFHRVCNDLGTNWCLMSAIAYEESRFLPHVRSYSGAIGLMQIMPRTATIYGLTAEEVVDPEKNIRVASLHYNLIEYMLNIPESTPEADRQALILAGYNGGIGRVFDAQRLARHFGEDPYSWHVVSQQIKNLRREEFYDLEVVQNGYFGSAHHTTAYVNRVMRRYRTYCQQTERCPHHLYPVIGHHH